MKLHVLVEGRSEEAFLKAWLRRARPFVDVSFILHQGKSDLLAQLPAKLRAYGRALDPCEHRLLVLVDADQDDCKALKARICDAHAANAPGLSLLVRIACEETEAFYLGERTAIEAGYGPLTPERAAALSEYVQDSPIGTAELFQRVIGAGSLNKVAWAKTMGFRLSVDPTENRSPSFRHLVSALDRLLV